MVLLLLLLCCFQCAFLRSSASLFDHFADRRIAQLCKSDLVQLDVAAAGLGQIRDLVPEDATEVGEERFDGRIGVTVCECTIEPLAIVFIASTPIPSFTNSGSTKLAKLR